MNTLMYAALVAMAAFTVTCWVFVFRYAKRPWRSTREGQAVMFLVTALATTTSVAFLFRFLVRGDQLTLRWIVYTTLFVVLTGILLRFHSLLVRKENNERSNTDSA